MSKTSHGDIIPLETREFSGALAESANQGNAQAPNSWPFSYIFDLQNDPSRLLPELPDGGTVKNLRTLAMSMHDKPADPAPGVAVPEIYTFLGQFIDHDITLERGSNLLSGLANPVRIPPEQIREHIVNSRSPDLDLDNVYGPDIEGNVAPTDPKNADKLLVEPVARNRGLPAGKDIYNDFPRAGDGTARIGDARDAENLVLAQLHVAFLRAHNELVGRGHTFEEARMLLIQHYQWIVLDDFLERVAEPSIVKKIRHHGPRFFSPPSYSFFIPLEFSGAAYRFGHAKVRQSYNNFNEKQESAALAQLFQFTRQRVTDDWVIDWTAFLDSENDIHYPRPIQPALNEVLFTLQDLQQGDRQNVPSLAERNLLRGYILGLPTGQAVAECMASAGITKLTGEQIKSVSVNYKDDPYRRDQDQAQVLEDAKFLTRTPLWFYILAEAAYYSRGYHLGPVGSTIVAEVLIGVLRNSTYSILSTPGWTPTLGQTKGKFDIEDLLALAGVLPCWARQL